MTDNSDLASDNPFGSPLKKNDIEEVPGSVMLFAGSGGFKWSDALDSENDHGNEGDEGKEQTIDKESEEGAGSDEGDAVAAPVPTTNAFAKLPAATGNWGAIDAADKSKTFSFGGAPAAAAPGAFTFGAAASTGATFSFGGGDKKAAAGLAADNPFGSPPKKDSGVEAEAKKESGFAFAAPARSETPFSFGSVQKTDFGADDTLGSPPKKGAEAEGEPKKSSPTSPAPEGVVEGADSTAQFKPVVQLQEVEVDSGEKEETEVYRAACALYRFDKESGEWKTRGRGDVRFLQHKETRRTRLVLRENKTLKLRMNHVVSSLVKLALNAGSDRSWTWSTTDYAEDEGGKNETFAIKFKTADVASGFNKQHEVCGKANQDPATRVLFPAYVSPSEGDGVAT
jgi:Ran-binding protein 1